jgi:protein scribble
MLCGLIRKRNPIDTADFTKQKLHEVPPDVYTHRQTLQRLCLKSNMLSAVPKGIQRFENLTELDISENGILFLPPTIGQLNKLKILNVSYNNLPGIPEGIENCEELISLNLSNNPIGRICEGATNLGQLRHLEANDCELDSLPSTIGRLSKLETLDIRDNHITCLPQSFRMLTNLEKLDIGSNVLETLSAVIGELESLKELWADVNLLMTLPAEFGQLKNLTFLELSDNQLIRLPSTFGMLESLAYLYMQKNALCELPESFGQLGNLQICHINENRLTTLPVSMEGMKSLIDLNLSHNHISSIPSDIGCISTLKYINFDENQLVSIPPEIGKCTSLSILSVRNNNIEELPSSIARLNNLSILNLVGNKLARLPIGITSISKLIAIWIAENQSRPMLEFQIQADPITGIEYLTCVLFPQQGHRALPDVMSSVSLTSNISQSVYSSQHQASSVNFDPHLATDKKTIGVSRDLTPYPKELHSKIRQWRAARDISGDNGPNDQNKEIMRRNSNKKINRPHSLIKALSNPIQDGSGLIDAPSRSCTQSPNILIQLSSSEMLISPKYDDKHSPLNGFQPEADIDIPRIRNNSNNSNNNQPVSANISSDVTTLDSDNKGMWYHTPRSSPLPLETTTTNTPNMEDNGNDEDSEDYDHLTTPRKQSTPEVTNHPSREERSYTPPILSPRTVPPQCDTDAAGPVNLTTLSPILQTTFNSKIKPHNGSWNSFLQLNHESSPDDVFVSRESPPSPADLTAVNDQSMKLLNDSKRFSSQQQITSKDTVGDHMSHYQSWQRSQVTKADNNFTIHQHPLRTHRQLSIDAILNSSRRSRAPTNESQGSYAGTSVSGRNTPDTARVYYKVMIIIDYHPMHVWSITYQIALEKVGRVSNNAEAYFKRCLFLVVQL